MTLVEEILACDMFTGPKWISFRHTVPVCRYALLLSSGQSAAKAVLGILANAVAIFNHLACTLSRALFSRLLPSSHSPTFPSPMREAFNNSA